MFRMNRVQIPNMFAFPCQIGTNRWDVVSGRWWRALSLPLMADRVCEPGISARICPFKGTVCPVLMARAVILYVCSAGSHCEISRVKPLNSILQCSLVLRQYVRLQLECSSAIAYRFHCVCSSSSSTFVRCPFRNWTHGRRTTRDPRCTVPSQLHRTSCFSGPHSVALPLGQCHCTHLFLRLIICQAIILTATAKYNHDECGRIRARVLAPKDQFLKDN